MLQNLIDRGPLGWIVLEDGFDQVLGWLRDSHCVWEAILSHSNFLVSGLNIVSFEWRLTDDKGVNNDTKGPDIDLV